MTDSNANLSDSQSKWSKTNPQKPQRFGGFEIMDIYISIWCVAGPPAEQINQKHPKRMGDFIKANPRNPWKHLTEDRQ